MRIAQINTDAALASTGTIASHLIQKLIEDGNECLLFYGRGIPGDPEYSKRFALVWEVLLHGLQTRLLGSHAQGSHISTHRLLQMLDEFQPDIIHLHNAHGYYLNLYTLLDYVALKDIPLVWTFHDAWPFTGHCAYFYDCKKWLTGCGKCPRKTDYPGSMLFDRSAEQWQKKREAIRKLRRLIFVTPSKWLDDLASQSFCANKPIRVIHNGIDTENIFTPLDALDSRRSFGIPEDKRVFVTVNSGWGDRRKGGHHLEQLVRRFSDKPVHFAVAGWKEKSDTLPVNMTALPVIYSPGEMARFYSMADVFLLLSEADNFPTVGIESLACGTPIIGFSAGGAPEQIDKDTGRMVKIGDVDSLESAINDFISGACTLSRHRCRIRAEALYSKQAMYEGYLRCYRDVMNF